MACVIPIKAVSNEDKIYIQDSLVVGEYDVCLDVIGDNIHLPFHFGFDLFELVLPPISFQEGGGDFSGELRPAQSEVASEMLKALEDKRCGIISCYPGFGKTITAIYIACKLGMKTLIVINRLVLVEQWVKSIQQFSPHTVQYLEAKTIPDADARFYVINEINLRKHHIENIGLLIIDELHQIMTKTLSKNILSVQPKCVLGLSATPYRFDDYDKVIRWFFGTSVSARKLEHPHNVYTVKSGFVPEVKYLGMKLDWNTVLQSQAEDDRRNELIVDTLLRFPDRVWLVLVKRVSHANNLIEIMKARDIKCETLMRTKVSFDKSAKVLIGTTSKIGVGFDHAAIDALFIAADVKNYFIQFLGRCMRRKNVIPVVVDIIDDFGPLKTHFNERVKTYKSHGGSVSKLREE